MSFLNGLDTNTVLIVAILIAGIFVYWRQGKSDVQSKAIVALGERISALEGERADLRTEVHQKDVVITQLQTKADEQTKQIDLLRQMVQGVPAWEKIVEGVNHLKVTSDKLDEMMKGYPSNILNQTQDHWKDTKEILAKLDEKSP